MGGAFITIFGENLKSSKLEIGGVVDASEDQGENFKVWFETMEGEGNYPCDVDRMFGLHVKRGLLFSSKISLIRTRMF